MILEWGFWTRRERDEKRDLGRSLGAAVELRLLDVPYDELAMYDPPLWASVLGTSFGRTPSVPVRRSPAGPSHAG